LKSGKAHPPRSNPPLRSSSGPPSPCITPSTETFVMVVSFMVAVPFWLGFVVVRFDRTAAPISSVAAESVRPIHSAPSPNKAQGDNARKLPGTSGITCCLHPPMTDSHTRRIGSRGPVNEIVGYAEIACEGPKTLASFGAVHPGHRRRGLGSCLIDLIEERALVHPPGPERIQVF
jgi:ribosomal protein S18 acetylase RimI-like enzyme